MLRRKENLTLLGVDSVSAQSVAAMANIMNMAAATTTTTNTASAAEAAPSSSASSAGSNAMPSNDTDGIANDNWHALRKRWRLLLNSDGGDAGGPTRAAAATSSAAGALLRDPSYVAAGYTPLIARLVQLLFGGDKYGKEAQSLFRSLPGPTIDLCGMDNECASNEDLSESVARSAAAATSSNDPAADFSGTKKAKRKKVLVVVVVGGISVLEMAALRCLSRDPDFPYHVVLAATEVLSSASLVRSCFTDD